MSSRRGVISLSHRTYPQHALEQSAARESATGAAVWGYAPMAASTCATRSSTLPVTTV